MFELNCASQSSINVESNYFLRKLEFEQLKTYLLISQEIKKDGLKNTSGKKLKNQAQNQYQKALILQTLKGQLKQSHQIEKHVVSKERQYDKKYSKRLNDDWRPQKLEASDYNYFLLCVSWASMIEQEHQEVNNQQNQLDGQAYSFLERAIRLLRKNTHYQFQDHIRGILIPIRYGEVVDSAPPKNQHALKIFWRCLITRYFKPIQDFDVEVLNYCKLLVNIPTKETQLPFLSSEIYETVINTLKKPPVTNPEALLNYQNLIYEIFIEFFCIQYKSKDKKNPLKIKHLRKDVFNIIPRLKLKLANSEPAELLKQKEQILKIFSECQYEDYLDHENEISKQIEELEAELIHIQKLSKMADEQIQSKTLVHIINTEQQSAFYQKHRDNVLEKVKAYEQNTYDRIQLQMKYLESSILELEHKQVAQSISKIYPKAKPADSIDIVFEKGSMLIQSSVNSKDLALFQKLRQSSALKFYNTSLKTRPYYITHLINGYQMLFKKKPIEALRNKDLYKELKESKEFKQLSVITDDTRKSFENYDICHHCKQLYDNIYLVKCTYHSSTMGPPSQSLSFIDPYIQQIIERQTVTSTRQFVNNEKNPYMAYHKKGNQYVCQRKYCKFCLRQSYDAFEKNGMCPFCQGICFCSRCLRNDTIIKLKTMYALMGGNISSLNKQSILYKLSQQNQNFIVQQQPILLPPAKGRPKKGKKTSIIQKVQIEPTENLKATSRQYFKLNDIRQELEQCRQICQIVRRRQKHKMYMVQNQQLIFTHIVNDLDLDFKVGKRPRSGDGSTQLQQVKKIKKIK